MTDTELMIATLERKNQLLGFLEGLKVSERLNRSVIDNFLDLQDYEIEHLEKRLEKKIVVEDEPVRTSEKLTAPKNETIKYSLKNKHTGEVKELTGDSACLHFLMTQPKDTWEMN